MRSGAAPRRRCALASIPPAIRTVDCPSTISRARAQRREVAAANFSFVGHPRQPPSRMGSMIRARGSPIGLSCPSDRIRPPVPAARPGWRFLFSVDANDCLSTPVALTVADVIDRLLGVAPGGPDATSASRAMSVGPPRPCRLSIGSPRLVRSCQCFQG